MKPGATVSPDASIRRVAAAVRRSPMAAMRSPRIPTSACTAGVPSPFSTEPPAIRRSYDCCGAGPVKQDARTRQSGTAAVGLIAVDITAGENANDEAVLEQARADSTQSIAKRREPFGPPICAVRTSLWHAIIARPPAPRDPAGHVFNSRRSKRGIAAVDNRVVFVFALLLGIGMPVGEACAERLPVK